MTPPLLPTLLPPHLPECVSVLWHGGGLEQKFVHPGTIVWRSAYTVGSHVCKYDRLFSIVADGIVDDICAPVTGYVRWLPWTAVRRVTPGYTLCVIEPEKSVAGHRIASGGQSVAMPVPHMVEVERIVEVDRELDIRLPFALAGQNRNKKWWIDTALEGYVKREAGLHNVNYGQMLLACAVAWGALSREQQEAAMKIGKGV